MVQNLYSLGLLRNGKVYPNKETAYRMLESTGTNDGVIKLARYLYQPTDGDTVVKTLIGFYANADEMEENGGGNSYYTIIDVEGNAEDIQDIKDEIAEINGVIGEGLSPQTLTEAITEVNNKLGSGFTENFTVADALAELNDILVESLTITLEESSGTSEYSKVYTLKQGGEVIGTINIPKDIVIKEGRLVHGTWSGDTFVEDPEGQDVAIKLVLNNGDVIYINAKELVDEYTAGNGIEIDNNEISVKLDESGEAFLTVGEDGLKLDGVQSAIQEAIEDAALESGDGISILNKKINAVAPEYSAEGINNPIIVDEDGIKLSSILDCGFYD